MALTLDPLCLIDGLCCLRTHRWEAREAWFLPNTGEEGYLYRGSPMKLQAREAGPLRRFGPNPERFQEDAPDYEA